MATGQWQFATGADQATTAIGLADRARAMIPTLIERGIVGDCDRCVPAATIDELVSTGMLQMLSPHRAGGSQASLLEFFDTALELAKGDGATAWLFGILGSHHWVASHLPVDGQEELFGPQGEALFPLTFSGEGGTARPVEGGYVVDGHWSFASGIDFSDWVGALAQISGDAQGTTINVIMRREEVTVIDNWFTSGMRGTGSRDFTARDVFVPHRRTLLQSDLMSGRTPGAASLPEYRGLKLPLHIVFLVPVIAVALGLARRALDEFISYTKGRIGYGGIDHGAKATTHAKIGHCAARWAAAHTRMRSQFNRVSRMVEGAEKITPQLRLAIRRDAALAAFDCVAIVQDVVGAAGARAQHNSSAFQLIQRDINTVRTHVILNEDDANELYGRQILGLDVSSLARQ